MPDKLRDQPFSRAWWRSWIYIVVGSFLLAGGYVLFINPYFIVPGGVYGAGIVLHYLFPSIQVGTFGFMFDIPLLILGIRIFGKMFGARTIVAAVLTPIFMNSLTWLIGSDPAQIFDGKIDLSHDIILACIFGGVIAGVGVGLVIMTRATTGGTDILAMIAVKYTGMKFSHAILIVDSCVVVFGIIVLGDWRIPLYSLITIFVISRMIEYVVAGTSYQKMLFIISDKIEDMRSFILEDMDRSATYIKSVGMYTHREKNMLFFVVNRSEVNIVQNKIKEIDPTAFVVVVNAHDTFGEGFKSLPGK